VQAEGQRWAAGGEGRDAERARGWCGTRGAGSGILWLPRSETAWWRGASEWWIEGCGSRGKRRVEPLARLLGHTLQ